MIGFFYLLGAATLGMLVGAFLMLWYVSFRNHQADAVTMSHGRRYDITKSDSGRYD